jgi:hypothetical protein
MYFSIAWGTPISYREIILATCKNRDQCVHEKYARHVQRDGGEAAAAASIAGISAFDAGALHL